MKQSELSKVWRDLLPDFKKGKFSKKVYEKDIFYNWIKTFKKRGKALDQGSGTGFYTIMLDKLGFVTTGIEISKTLLDEANKNKKRFKCNYKMILGDVRNMPFKNKSFDLVLSGGIIEHFPETQKAIKEQYRVLKKGGILLIHVPHRISIFTLTKILQKLFRKWKSGYEKSFTIWRFKNMLKKAGFKIKKTKIKKIQKGKNKWIFYILTFFNFPLDIIGLGGHHMFFYCKKE